MDIVVTGGAGFLGGRLIAALLQSKPEQPFRRILSVDVRPCPVDSADVVSLTGDITDPDLLGRAITPDTGAVYHLAAVVSSMAEADFALGMRVNLDGTRGLLEACRTSARRPRFVFSSSLAVFGGALPEIVPDSAELQPRSSYGTQKAVGEMLVADYSRKGYVDGRVCRLPTIVVRPGKPNAAASSFASGIVREPLAGLAAVCPVPLSTRMWISSPDRAVANLLRCGMMEGAPFAERRAINLPGICVAVGEMLDTLAEVAGAEARRLVTLAVDERIAGIVASWPGAFDVGRALSLGLERDASFRAIIEQYRRGGAAMQGR